MKIKDNELRGIVLQRYYDRRQERFIQFKNNDFPNLGTDFDTPDLFRICEQLASHGYIEFKPIPHQGQIVGGAGMITASGVDLVEMKTSPLGFSIIFDGSTHSHTTVNASTGVQIGNSNVQGDITVGKIISAIDDSNASDEQKEEAKSLLKSALNNPLVKTAFGSAAHGLRTWLGLPGS